MNLNEVMYFKLALQIFEHNLILIASMFLFIVFLWRLAGDTTRGSIIFVVGLAILYVQYWKMYYGPVAE